MSIGLWVMLAGVLIFLAYIASLLEEIRDELRDANDRR